MPDYQSVLRITLNAQGASTKLTGLNKKLTDFGKTGDSVTGKIRAFGRNVVTAFSNLSSLAKFGIALGVITAALAALTLGLVSFVKSYTIFEKQMAEVATLVDTASISVDALSGHVRRLSVEFGADTGVQAKALYQIISSGAEASTEAITILTAANKLAIGGVTDVETAADGLTSFINAYSRSGTTATEVSDALFVAMRGGKTTVEELSLALGLPAPIAAQLGVSFDSLAGAIASITIGGVTTRLASFQLKAILESILKPTSEASAAAEKLGISFGSTALQGTTFIEFIQDITEKTGGSADALVKLFPNVRALQGLLALTGGQAEKFAEIMEDMENKAGETEVAFGKLTNTFEFDWDVLIATFKEIGLVLKEFVLPVVHGLAIGVKALADGFLAFLNDVRSIDTRTLDELLKKRQQLQRSLQRRPDGRLADSHRQELSALNAIIDLQSQLTGQQELTAIAGGEVIKTFKELDGVIVRTASLTKALDAIKTDKDIALFLSNALEAIKIREEAGEITAERASRLRLAAVRDTNALVGTLTQSVEEQQAIAHNIRTDAEIAEGFAARLRAINDLQAAGSISDERAGRLKVEAAEAVNTEIGTPDSDPVDLDVADEKLRGFSENFFTAFEEMRVVADDVGGAIGQSLGGAFTNAVDNLSAGVARVIVQGGNLGQALKAVAQTFAAAVIQSLVKIGVQMLINATLGTALTTASVTAQATAMGSIAAAAAPAAALVSLATAGSNAIGANAGIASTLALTTGIAAGGLLGGAAGQAGGSQGASRAGAAGDGLRGFADGGFVSGAGGARDDMIPALLSNGEFVINADATRNNRALLESINNSQVSPPRFQDGGFVGNSAPQQSTGENPVSINVTVQNETRQPIDVETRNDESTGQVVFVIKEALRSGLLDDELEQFGALRVPEE